MKKTINLLVLTVCFLITANQLFAQNANTFYVCSGTNFTLVPSDTTFTDFEWNEIGGSSNPIATTKTSNITAPTLGGTTYSTKQYTLRVKDGTGCWSDVDTFTVNVLPAISVTMSGNSGPYCASSSTSVTLTATVGSLTLPTGVAADQYAWTAGGSGTGSNSSTLSISSGTTAGSTVYAVSVTYSLPGGNGGSKLTSCSGSANTTLVVNNVPTTPSVSIQ